MQIRTDLAMESREWTQHTEGVSYRTLRHGCVEETCVTVETEEAAKAMDKAVGQYITVSYPALAHADVRDRMTLSKALADTLRALTPPLGDLLVVGLGNRRITADALGSRVLESLLITRHMREALDDSLQGRLRGVCAIAPGVLGVTGIETAEVIQGVVQRTHPSAVIAIDALAARESGRICTTIQVTDTGIRPGSGVGNHRMGLTRETLGVPVIAVGVPMVVYASVIARDALTLLMADLDASGDNHEQAIDEMVRRVIRDGMGEMVVTPREVDEMVGRVAEIIAEGMNMAFQPRLTRDEIQRLTHDGL